uniref:Uncharacterized protein n=1 Tax=Romanomermis culicivorax TaxID=13658 RepID=A0A915JJE1_ROMCU
MEYTSSINVPNGQSSSSSTEMSKLYHNTKDGLSKTSGRKIIVVRHGERIDFTFNPTHESWVRRAFDPDGNYKRFNINMPRTLPRRQDGFMNYLLDTPLTEMGYLQAKITGRALKDSGCKPTYVYASPAYRSIQTAVGIIKGLNMQDGKLLINIETALFEWGGWFRPKMPNWMMPDELFEHGYPINVDYQSLGSKQDISPMETLADYYNRSFSITRKILERHQHEDCIIALIAHGASLDTCTRQLTGGSPRNQQDFYAILHQTPYLALAAAREDYVTKAWKLCEPPIHPFQHQGNASYDWTQLHQ